jgi:putative transposase
MARLPRVIAVDGPHHVTQRGNARRFILDNDTDRNIYLDLLKQSLALHGVAMMGYCPMSNHVHLVLIPSRAESLGRSLNHAHGRLASCWNAIHQSSGHVWQGRYYSCLLDEPHLWEALRYTEMNPVRAGLVAELASWVWSSAATHCAAERDAASLALEQWQARWTAESWRAFLKAEEDESALARSVCRPTPDGPSALMNSCTRWSDRHSERWRHKSVAGDQDRSPTKDRLPFTQHQEICSSRACYRLIAQLA